MDCVVLTVGLILQICILLQDCQIVSEKLSKMSQFICEYFMVCKILSFSSNLNLKVVLQTYSKRCKNYHKKENWLSQWHALVLSDLPEIWILKFKDFSHYSRRLRSCKIGTREYQNQHYRLVFVKFPSYFRFSPVFWSANNDSDL